MAIMAIAINPKQQSIMSRYKSPMSPELGSGYSESGCADFREITENLQVHSKIIND